jgi:tetratricopeptide (TPR) repeat protein
MRKARLLLLLLFLIPCSLEAQDVPQDSYTQNIEQHFQQGISLWKSRNIEGSINEFQQVVAADLNKLDKNYAQQTISEAYFNIGSIYIVQQKMDAAEMSLQKAISIFPEHKRSLFYLAFVYIGKGDVARVLEYYSKAKALGFEGDHQPINEYVARFVNTFKRQEFDLEYKPVMGPAKNAVVINIKGNSRADHALMKDVIAGIEKEEYIYQREVPHRINISATRLNTDGTICQEKWEIQNGDERIYWVIYDLKPPAGFPMKVLIKISTDENSFDQYVASKTN